MNFVVYNGFKFVTYHGMKKKDDEGFIFNIIGKLLYYLICEIHFKATAIETDNDGPDYH